MSRTSFLAVATSAAPDTSAATSRDPYLHHLAQLVADHGITAFEGDVARLAVRLRALGVTSPLVPLLTDRTAAAVARERALGVLLSRLEAIESATAPAAATAVA